MKPMSRIPLIAAGASALTLLAISAGPSQAQPNRGAPTETGCYDITSGSIDFTRHLEYSYTTVTPQFQHEADLGTPAPHTHVGNAVPTYSRAFTDQADVILTATIANGIGADCSGVTYRLRIYDEDHALLADLAVPGGSGNEITWQTAFDYPRSPDGFPRAAYFSGTTETSTGRVVDTAPDDVTGVLATIDEGGAVSSFK